MLMSCGLAYHRTSQQEASKHISLYCSILTTDRIQAQSPQSEPDLLGEKWPSAQAFCPPLKEEAPWSLCLLAFMISSPMFFWGRPSWSFHAAWFVFAGESQEVFLKLLYCMHATPQAASNTRHDPRFYPGLEQVLAKLILCALLAFLKKKCPQWSNQLNILNISVATYTSQDWRLEKQNESSRNQNKPKKKASNVLSYCSVGYCKGKAELLVWDGFT